MKIIKPCMECPYKLGLVQTFVNPCLQCKAEGYKMFEIFKRQFPTVSDPTDNDNKK